MYEDGEARLVLDPNALYLHCLMQDMLTGWNARRQENDEFKLEPCHQQVQLQLSVDGWVQ